MYPPYQCAQSTLEKQLRAWRTTYKQLKLVDLDICCDALRNPLGLTSQRVLVAQRKGAFKETDL